VPFRLLHLADLHLERSFAAMGCQGDLARRRRQGLRDALRRAGDVARERGCIAVTIGGDLFEHDRAGADTAHFLVETFASWAPMRVLIAAGNHDPLLPGSIYLRTVWPGNVHLFRSSALEPVELAPGLTVWGLGHMEPAWQGDPLDGAAAPAEGTHLALFHGAEISSRPEGKSIHGPFRAERIREAGFAALLCGHYHRRRLDTATGLCYPGSPEPLTFDESEPRGPVLVEVGDSGAVSFEGLSLNRWHAAVIPCDLDGVSGITAAVDRIAAAVLAGTAGCNLDCTTLRVDVTGEVRSTLGLDSYDAENAVRESTGVAALRIRDLTVPAADLDVIAKDASARGAFVRATQAALGATTDAGERAVLEDALRYGLQALSGSQVGLR
jgi:exonuclease SbcD